MGKHRKQKLRVPSDKLPPAKLQEAWDKYLDVAVGRQGARPRWEVLIDPQTMDAVIFQQLRELEIATGTSRSDVYIQAFNNVINRLPLLQQIPLKYYFGIDMVSPLTQEEIAKELGIAQKNVIKRMNVGMKNLKLLIRKELANVVREELNKETDNGIGSDSPGD